MNDQTQEEISSSTQVPLVEADILRIIRDYNKSSGFTDRKLTDTPTDSLQVVNRKYVTANGTTANRPPSPVTGQYFFDSTLGKPIWYSGSAWVLATGVPA